MSDYYWTTVNTVPLGAPLAKYKLLALAFMKCAGTTPTFFT
jgi:hypothetical protein